LIGIQKPRQIRVQGLEELGVGFGQRTIDHGRAA
jgi:hypothetical protein